jgi:tRNA(Ile)-lysidine synthetase-like protein
MQSHELSNRINWPSTGKYVIAVSGGVDSVCLLDVMAQSDRAYELIVAHFDHGMRADSRADAEFVRELSSYYGLKFATERAELAGKGEAEARAARYEFLERTMVESKATAIITAHHADDRLETSLINALRGTGAAGLVALTDEPNRRRPLLKIPKLDLIGYAQDQKLKWREDSTNESNDYTRNLIRHEVLGGQDWEDYRHQQEILASTIEQYRYELSTWSGTNGVVAIEQEVILPLVAIRQLTLDELGLALTEWLRQAFGQNPLEMPKVEKLALFCKHARAGSILPLGKQITALMEYDRVVITSRVRHNIDTPQADWLLPGNSVIYGQYRLRFGGPLIGIMQFGIKSDKIQIRTVQPGDRIRLNGGTKKLHNLFIDAKVDRPSRATWPIVCSPEGEIIAIPGLAYANQPSQPRHYLSYEEL